MSVQGMVLKVRILMTDETVPLEHFADLLQQSTSSEKPNGHTTIAGTLLLENNHQFHVNGDVADHSSNQPPHALLLVAPADWRSQAPIAAHEDSPETVPAIHSAETGSNQERAETKSENKASPSPPAGYLPVKSARKVILLKVDDIDWIQAGHNRVTLQVRKQAHHLRGTLEAFQQRLPPNRFVRINRSNIVQIDRIKVLDRLVSGGCQIELHDGTHLTLSRRYRAGFHAMGLL
jgi:hypothetical protein